MFSKYVERYIIILFVANIFCCSGQQHNYDNNFLYGQFPTGFKWGFATASYQVLNYPFFETSNATGQIYTLFPG